MNESCLRMCTNVPSTQFLRAPKQPERWRPWRPRPQRPSSANGTCDMMDRIKNRDVGMNVTATETPCEMVVRSNDHRQVVAVMYNSRWRCKKGLGPITVSDGNMENNTMINNKCRNSNVSYASRRNGLIITLAPPLQQFDIDLYLIDTDIVYTTPSGIITSPRYPGYVGESIDTTPNNYHGVYKIVSAYNVSMYLKFTEFRVQPSPIGMAACAKDVVKIRRDHIRIAEYCGDNVLPSPVNALGKQLTLEYITDDVKTHPGFSALYMMCIQEVNETKSIGSIDFGMFPPVDRTCIFTIRLQQRERIRLNLELELSTPRNCSQYLTIFRDNEKNKDSSCDGFQFIHAEELRLEFNLHNGEIIEGYYSIDIQNIEQDEVTPTRTTITFINSDSAMAIGVALSVMGVVVTLCNIIIYIDRRKKFTSKPRQNESGSHASRDHLNLHAVRRYDYESPIQPASEINHSIPGEVRGNTSPREDDYFDIVSTEHQLDNMTNSSQREEVYESTVIDSNIYEHEYIEFEDV